MSKGTRNVAPQSIQQAHDVALAALLRGWRPLPITADGRKIPLVKFTSESGANLTATSSADVWSLWLEEFRGAGVAIVTGSRSFEGSGVLVVDVDVKDGAPGLASLEAAFAELGPLPATMVVRSPSGGFHYVYAYPDDSDTWRNWNGWRPGIDIRGHHGIVAVPGSTDARGTYTLEVDMEPTTLPPTWLEALVRPAANLATRDSFAERDLAEADPELRRQRVIARDEIEILARQLETPGPGKHGRLVFAATAAGSWSHLIGDDDWLEEKLLRALERAHTVRGGWIDERKSRAGIRQLMHTGQVNPKWAPRVPVTLLGNIADYGLAIPGPPKPREWTMRPWDDIGNAERLADHAARTLAWISDAEQWAAYDGIGWTLSGAASLAIRAAQDMLEALPATEALEYDATPEVDDNGKESGSPRDGFLEHVKKTRSDTKVRAMLGQAKGRRGLAVPMEAFDAEPMLLNVANGVIDLSTGALLEHSPELRLIQRSSVPYDPLAPCTAFDAFLAQVMPAEEMRAYLARIVGYTLTGQTGEQVMFIHHGSGANGKSVFMDILVRVLGQYAQSVPRSTLLVKNGSDGIPNDIARMRGKRLLRTSETAAGKKLDDDLVKDLVGGEQMSARHMRAEFFDFTPTGKIHLTTNHLPHLSTGGYAMARRVRDIGWDVTIPDGERDPELAARISATELSGVLSWAVRGCLSWQAAGLQTPQAVLDKTAEHMANADPLGDWIAARLDRVPGAQIELSRLYADYRAHAEAAGEKPMIARSLSEALTERGFSRGDTIGRNKVRVFDHVTFRLTPLQEAGQGLWAAQNAGMKP